MDNPKSAVNTKPLMTSPTVCSSSVDAAKETQLVLTIPFCGPTKPQTDVNASKKAPSDTRQVLILLDYAVAIVENSRLLVSSKKLCRFSGCCRTPLDLDSDRAPSSVTQNRISIHRFANRKIRPLRIGISNDTIATREERRQKEMLGYVSDKDSITLVFPQEWIKLIPENTPGEMKRASRNSQLSLRMQ
jgi:hypothetical protein